MVQLSRLLLCYLWLLVVSALVSSNVISGFVECFGSFRPTRWSATRTQRTASTAPKVTVLQAAKRTASSTKKKNNNAAPKAVGGFGKSTGKWDGCEVLKKWLLEKGAEIDPVVSIGVVDPNTSLRGVKACREFKRGDVLFSVPRDYCILDENKADSSPMAAAIYPSQIERKALPPPIRVALFLLWLERVPSLRAAWKPALDALPTPADFAAEGGPMQLWTDDELAEVECCQLIAEVRRRSVELKEHFEKRVLPRWTEASERTDGPLTGIQPPSFTEFQHAVCVITSRTFGEGEPEGGSSAMLVPGVDMFNHDDPPAVNTKHALAPRGNFVVLAQKSIKEGEQIKLTYGPLPNRLLLAQFGFLLSNREIPLLSDTALVRIDSLLQDSKEDAGETKTSTAAKSEAAADAEWEEGPGPMKFINLKGNRSPTGRLSRWQPAAVARMAANFVAEGDKNGKIGSELFRGLIERELSAYSSTLEEDEERLAGILDKSKTMPIRSEWALRFRIESKRFLMKELESL